MGKTQDHQAGQAMVGERFSGLYNAAYEHDACGVGMVVNIHGNNCLLYTSPSPRD